MLKYQIGLISIAFSTFNFIAVHAMAAESVCTSKSESCFDAKTKTTRTCVTTSCYDPVTKTVTKSTTVNMKVPGSDGTGKPGGSTGPTVPPKPTQGNVHR
jgi:hypothetical protein